MRPLDLTPRGVLGTIAVLLVAGTCIRLGIWQLDRRAERQARNRAVAERLEAEPVALERVPIDTTGLSYRRARLVGTIDDDRALVLAGRSRNGAPGVHVLSPIRLGTGAVLVDRGWLPAADAATVDLDAARLRGEVRVDGVLVPFPDADLNTDPDGFQVRWFRFDGDAIRGQYPYAVAPLYVMATSRPEPLDLTGVTATDPDRAHSVGTRPARPAPMRGDSALTPVPLEPPTLDPGPHLSYAVQWFSFATIALVGWAILVLRGTGRSSAGSGGPRDGPAVGPAPSTR